MIDTFVSNVVAVSSSVLMLVVLVLSALALWVWALVACVNSTKDTSEKLIWVLVIIFFNVLGALIYLMVHHASTQRAPSKSGASKRLYRSRDDTVLGGVCSGIAKYFGIDPVIIRIAFVLLFLFKGSGLLIYLICWIIIPKEPKITEKDDKKKSGGKQHKKTISSTSKQAKKTRNPLLIGIVLFVVIFLALFAAVFLFGLASYQASKSFSKHVFVDEQGIVIHDRSQPRSLVISPQRVSIVTLDDELQSIKALVEKRITSEHNYQANNGTNLEYKGVSVLGHDHCQPVTATTLSLRNTCAELRYTFDVTTEHLPESVTGFEVKALVIDTTILHVSFSERVVTY